MRQSVQRNKRLIEDRCAATLGGKSHYYRGSESTKKKIQGVRGKIFLGARGASSLASGSAKFSIAEGIWGEKHIKYT